MRYGIGDDRNSNFVFTPGRYTEVICRLLYRSENSGRKSEFRGGRFSEHLKYSARQELLGTKKMCCNFEVVLILRWSLSEVPLYMHLQ